MTKTERIENIVKKLKTRKSKNIIYSIFILFVCMCFGYRFYVVNQESNFDVFNIIREHEKNGVPVDVLEMHKSEGVLYEPLTIKNNRAYVAGDRINIFKVGQQIDNCKIVHVSHSIDLDSGMFVIKTKNCKDGLQYVQKNGNGFYIPVSALHGNGVYVIDNGKASFQEVVVEDRDSQNVLIKSGLKDGDIVILSDVKDGQKIKD